MKILNCIAVATAIFAGIGFIQAQQSQQRYVSVGPIIAGSVDKSSLPKEAIRYIDRHFKGLTMVSVEREFLNGRFDVELSDYTEIEFDAKGKVMEIDAPDGYVLEEDVIKSILPDKAVKLLKSKNYINQIESAKRTRNGYSVDVDDRNDTEIQFDKSGSLISIKND